MPFVGCEEALSRLRWSFLSITVFRCRVAGFLLSNKLLNCFLYFCPCQCGSVGLLVLQERFLDLSSYGYDIKKLSESLYEVFSQDFVLVNAFHDVFDAEDVFKCLDAPLNDQDCLVWLRSRTPGRLHELAEGRYLRNRTEDVSDDLSIAFCNALLLYTSDLLECSLGKQCVDCTS